MLFMSLGLLKISNLGKLGFQFMDKNDLRTSVKLEPTYYPGAACIRLHNTE